MAATMAATMMTLVPNKLYLGSFDMVLDADWLRDNRIVTVLSVVAAATSENGVDHCESDEEDEKETKEQRDRAIQNALDAARVMRHVVLDTGGLAPFRRLQEMLDAPGAMLVHCCGHDVWRTTVMVAVALQMHATRRPLVEVLASLRRRAAAMFLPDDMSASAFVDPLIVQDMELFGVRSAFRRMCSEEARETVASVLDDKREK